MAVRLLLLSVLVALSAQAQERPRERPTTGQRVILVLGSTAGGLTAGFVGPFVPVSVAATTYATSAALGFDPAVGGVLVDTAIGTAVGVGVMVATRAYLVEVADAESGFSVDIGSFFVGVAAGSVATGVVHGARVRLAPAALAAPTGERSTGLSLRVRL